MKKTGCDFLKDQSARVPPVPQKDLKGKTVVIIGANTGIGFEVAKHMTSMNPERLILGCRSKARGEEAIKSMCKRILFK
jgi:retinol dehydrogenase 12